MKSPTSLLNNVSTLAIVCSQWGDSGKGKFVDLFSDWADVIARGTGGANAGHTIKIGEEIRVFNLLPSGILHDGDGKINVIGSGVAFDPKIACNELEALGREGKRPERLRISHAAHLVLPQHILMDRLRETKKGKLGTTLRGIGPTYVDHQNRIGLCVNDLLNPDILRKKIHENIGPKIETIRGMKRGKELAREIMHQEFLEWGAFWGDVSFFNVSAIVDRCAEHGKLLEPYISDTDSFMRDAERRGKRILLEGSQGILLSADHGTYPQVTSCDCSPEGLAKGVGLRERDVDLTLATMKAFYMTRVGEGPFPTELGGLQSAEHCRKCRSRELEWEMFPDLDMNAENPLLQGIAIRAAGNEYGATTGRLRRIGWLDLPLARYAKTFVGKNVILTKLDVLSPCKTIKICTHHAYFGPLQRVAEKELKRGVMLETAIPHSEVLSSCAPSYEEFDGWMCDIRGARSWRELPPQLKKLVQYVERGAGLKVRALSIGPERSETIVR